MIKTAVIGYGYWGPNLVRNFSESGRTTVVGVSDLREDRLVAAQRRFPGVQATQDAASLIHDPGVDAVAISTPVFAHYDLAMAALKAGKHVLVEKPITATSEQAMRLIDEAAKRNLTLMVDHTFVYTGAVRKIRELVRKGDLGDILYYDSVRVNLGLFQRDVDVIWDLAVHDLSIMNYVLDCKAMAVTASGMSHVTGGPENIAYLTVFCGGNLLGHINVNWLSPVKLRRTLIGGASRMIVYDDMENSEKVKVYDKGITVTNGPESTYQAMIGYRSGDMYAPQLEVTEALGVEIRHFADCIENGAKPITGGEAGLAVVQVLEAATLSMRNRGQLVEINHEPAIVAA